MNNQRINLHSLASALAAVTLLGAGAAQASVTVAPTAPDVSYSQNATIGLVSYVGYEYTVTNSTAALATATVAGTVASGVSGQTPVFVGTVNGVAIPESGGCKVGKTTNTFSCSFSVAARATVKRVVYFRVPDKLSTNTLANGTRANCAQGIKGIDCLRLTTSSAKIGATTFTVPASFAGLGTDPTLAFKTASPSVGATYFTGRTKGGLSSADDPASTIVTVPRTGTSTTLNGYTIANLIERPTRRPNTRAAQTGPTATPHSSRFRCRAAAKAGSTRVRWRSKRRSGSRCAATRASWASICPLARSRCTTRRTAEVIRPRSLSACAQPRARR